MAEYKNVENIKKLFDEEFKKTRRLIQKGETHLDNLAEGFLEADRVISKLPTADVVEVVRCKNCKHFYRDVYNGKVLQRECRLRSIGSGIGTVFIESETDFCSYGERKEGNA